MTTNNKPCILCGQFNQNINERGICNKCYNFKVPKPIQFERNEHNLFPIRNGYILTRDMWNNIKNEIENFYRYISDEDIEILNFKRKDTRETQKPKNNHINGYVYLLKSSNGYYKLGRTKNITRRLLGYRSKYPLEMEIIHIIPSKNYVLAETFLLNSFSECKLYGEWFSLNDDAINWILQLTYEKLELLLHNGTIKDSRRSIYGK